MDDESLNRSAAMKVNCAALILAAVDTRFQHLALSILAGLAICTSAAASPTIKAPSTISAPIVPAATRQLAQGFELQDAAGHQVSLVQYRGKVVLLDFWTTECGGCVREMSFFMSLARTSKNPDLAIVGVSVDVLYESLHNTEEGWSKVKPFIKSHNVPYQILMADDAVTKRYNIQALPLTYLIDKHGKVAATYLGVVNEGSINTNIKALLAEGP
jgi:peroxiredoxin